MEILFLCNLLTFNILYHDSAYQSRRPIGWKFNTDIFMSFFSLFLLTDMISSCIQNCTPVTTQGDKEKNKCVCFPEKSNMTQREWNRESHLNRNITFLRGERERERGLLSCWVSIKVFILITWVELLLYTSAKLNSFNCDEMCRQATQRRRRGWGRRWRLLLSYLPSGKCCKGALERKSSCLEC